jgi:hypothetical protein
MDQKVDEFGIDSMLAVELRTCLPCTGGGCALYDAAGQEYHCEELIRASCRESKSTSGVKYSPTLCHLAVIRLISASLMYISIPDKCQKRLCTAGILVAFAQDNLLVLILL